MNGTLGAEGVVPSALVLGEFPSWSSYLGANILRSTLSERPILSQKAKKLTSKHLGQLKSALLSNKKAPVEADQVNQHGDLVLVWRESQIENRKGKLVVPYTVIAVDSIHKNVLVRQHDERSLERYSTAQINL